MVWAANFNVPQLTVSNLPSKNAMHVTATTNRRSNFNVILAFRICSNERFSFCSFTLYIRSHTEVIIGEVFVLEIMLFVGTIIEQKFIWIPQLIVKNDDNHEYPGPT